MTKTKAPTTTRNIPQELAQIQRERGYALTRPDFTALGYTDADLCPENITAAATLYAQMSERQAA